MNRDFRPEHLADTIGNLTRYWEGRRQAERGREEGPGGPPAFTIALDRETGTPATAVARAIGDRLGWMVYDHELLERIAQEMGLRTSLLESVDERRENWMLETFNYFLSVPAVTERSYVRHLVETILALGSHGECVIVGRGAAQILPAETTLRVRLVAPPAHDRAAAAARELGLSRHEAERQVETTDREHLAFVRDHFRKDAADPRNYDLVLNTGRFTPAECAGLVVEALGRLQSRRAAAESAGKESVALHA